MGRKGQVWVSAVIYVLIAVTALVIILAATQPLIARMKDKAAVQKQKETMAGLDEQISGVATEGPGSQRAVPVDISDGTIMIKNDSLVYDVQTESKVVEPRTQTDIGNLRVGSGTDVSAYETNNSYVLENSKIKVYFIKSNNITNTSQIIQKMQLLSTNATVTQGFTFNVGTGTSVLIDKSYTSMMTEGSSMGAASVIAHCNQTSNEYDLVFELGSEADFIKVNIANKVR